MRSRLLQRGTLIAGLVLLAGCLSSGADDATGNNAGGTTGEPSDPVPGTSSGGASSGSSSGASSGGSSSGEGGTVDPPSDAGPPTDASDGSAADAGEADGASDAAADGGVDPANAGGDPADAGPPPDPPFLIYTCSRKKASYADYDAYFAGDAYWAIDSLGNKFTGVRPADAPNKTKIGAEAPMFYSGPAVGTASPPAGANPAGQLTAAELATLRAAIATLTAGPAEGYPTQTGGGSGYLLASSWTSDAAGKARRMDYDQYRFGLHVSAEMWFHKSTYAAANTVRKYNCAVEFGTIGTW